MMMVVMMIRLVRESPGPSPALRRTKINVTVIIIIVIIIIIIIIIITSAEQVSGPTQTGGELSHLYSPIPQVNLV